MGLGTSNISNLKQNHSSINRLIIIGNGFDLAHDYKTRYSDFLFNYLQRALFKFFNEKFYSDDFLEISMSRNKNFDKIYSCESFDEAIDILAKLKSHRDTTLVFKSILMNKLLERTGKINNWVDIELEYYNLLKYYFKNNRYKEIKVINDDLDLLTDLLKKYLIYETQEANVYSSNILNLFYQKVISDDIVTVKLSDSLYPEHIHILNFNYTDTLSKHTNTYNRSKSVTLNYIHGELHKDENPLIFGFGDEIDDNYKLLENKNKNELLRHVKSFKYFKTVNYHNLIRFIDSNIYQVFILGHSCGLSDRTMLNQIFEHENCVSIRIFYHQKDDGSDDYIEKTFEISRHFSNKGMMRKKIIPKERSFPIPKPEKID